MSHARRSSRWLVGLALALCLLFVGRLAAQEGKQRFSAGAFAVDITPKKFPVSVNGGMQDRLTKTVHDRLHARCLVMHDGATTLALVVCDSCMIPREIIDEARDLIQKSTKIPGANI